jgi:small basic protein
MAADLHTISRITQIWSDRLQLISVYVSDQKSVFDAGNPQTFSAYIQATFFTSIDSVLFSLASSRDKHNTASKVMLASLVGALIFHAAAGIQF